MVRTAVATAEPEPTREQLLGQLRELLWALLQEDAGLCDTLKAMVAGEEAKADAADLSWPSVSVLHPEALVPMPEGETLTVRWNTEGIELIADKLDVPPWLVDPSYPVPRWVRLRAWCRRTLLWWFWEPVPAQELQPVTVDFAPMLDSWKVEG